MSHDARVLDRLAATIHARRGADAANSYTAKLLAAGRRRVAQKMGEEALETVIAGVGDSSEALVAESADLLYHLLVLWESAGVAPMQVWDALAAREGVSGIAEKASRRES